MNRVVVKKQEFGNELVMFFNDVEVNYGTILAYKESTGHFETTLEYYKKCKKAGKAEAEQMVQKYNSKASEIFEPLQLKQELDYSAITEMWDAIRYCEFDAGEQESL